ncbi:flagellar hook-length control protein FliK [Pseudomonas sp. HR96]|uniref:flagellar hook-length control protein FliK n=1 Tax=Pseudomonas sp. HR96 TaxID=1027966 RepID=UPI002A74AD9E|nr:flagellar hook-length control protein FliK [Pseudomonas sp. HR96]WPP01349.1 flagellar hook-length control protein FliK [Pseudomonas sp. HR96]
MTSEITSLSPPSGAAAVPPALATAARNAAATGDLLQLLQPEAVVPSDQTAPAQVLTLKQAGQAFELLLQVTLASGQQTTVKTSSPQPLLPGTALTVSQPTSSTLAVTVQQARSDAVSALVQLDTSKLPVGTLLQGKVLTSQLLPQANGQPAVYRALVSLLNSAQAGAVLTLDSPQPLRLGSLLSAQVQGSQQLQFVPLSGRLDQLALTQQLAAQQGRQASLPSMLAGLAALQQADMVLPADVQDSLQTLLASLPELPDMANPKALAQALQGSGVFMEPALLAGQAASQPVDLKTGLLRLIAQLTPLLPAASSFNPAAPNNAVNALAQGLPGYVRNALGMLGQVGAKPEPVGFPLPERLLAEGDGEGDIEHLLRLASAAISRLQSHQLSSLEQTGINPQGRVQTTWQLEIPMRNLQDIVPLQVKLQREDLRDDEAPPRRENERPAPAQTQHKLWRLELAFDLAPLGPLQVQAQLLHGVVSSDLWAEQPSTAQLIAAQLGTLRARLLDCGLNVSELNCHQGIPPRGPRTRLEQRWVDETA